MKGTAKTFWSGHNSFVDPQFIEKYPKFKKMSLERSFAISDEDFLNLFSTAHITSIRGHNNYYTNYKIIEVKANESQALHFEFNYPNPTGFFDFSVKQFDTNKTKTTT